jgi:hypothetical protein
MRKSITQLARIIRCAFIAIIPASIMACVVEYILFILNVNNEFGKGVVTGVLSFVVFDSVMDFLFKNSSN